MFELIGLMFATLLLFGLAVTIAAAFAAITWHLTRNGVGHKRLTLLAASVPLASAAYLWICVAILPGESPFGDISQPLPNNYTLQALGKMPDYASIIRTSSPVSGDIGLSEWIGEVAVSGALVVGQYSHPFGGFNGNSVEPFFIFDTHNGQHIDLATLADVEAKLNHPVVLTEVQHFRSQEPAYRRQQNLNKLLMFSPPIIVLGILSFSIGQSRSRTQPPSSNIYT